MSRRSNRGPPDRSLRADEVYCTSCGEAIKREAELCPNCGVRNEVAGGGRSGSAGGRTGRSAAGSTGGTAAGTATTGSASSRAGTAGASATGGTTVSDTWWYGVAGATALWAVLLVLSGVNGSLGALGGLLVLVAWIGLPASAYFDMQYVRANGDWDPNTAVWVLVLAIWFVGMVAGAVYLYRRHETLGTP
ncbi:zinc ribbon domain-containing protein [Halopenitus persicus]|uniref:zinc ribbon domain-containing protein n=1 Tax=Halopenitus persicus TaxID=1048396 RepID=UPI000BBA527E|nr:zinc ribbon domain-containing protein [Halopenitus persicus]